MCVRRIGRWSINPSVGLSWLSEDAADYYYGVRPSEAMPGLAPYEVDASINTFARIAVSYAIDEHWKIGLEAGGIEGEGAANLASWSISAAYHF